MRPNFSHDSRLRYRNTRAAYIKTPAALFRLHRLNVIVIRGGIKIYRWKANIFLARVRRQASFCFGRTLLYGATIWGELDYTSLPRQRKDIILGAKCRLNKKKLHSPWQTDSPNLHVKPIFQRREKYTRRKPIRTKFADVAA